MNNLIWSNFRRLLGDKAYIIECACMLGLSVFFPLHSYMEQGSQANPNNYFFGFNLLIGIFSSVCCSLYLGTEYSDGTIRNKLIAGHTRKNIYLANLLVCTFASLLVTVIYILAESLVGIPLLGRVQMDGNELLVRFFTSGLMIVAFSSIFTLFSMLIQNKAISAVINILLALSLLLAAVYIMSRLSEPEFIENYMYMDNLGTIVAGDPTPNPLYLQETSRAVYEFLNDFLPSGQGLQMCIQILFRWGRMAWCNVGITMATTILGLYAFQRKNIQ
ncbi:MAG: ABC transporter permease subunit [Lachnospiraceae bacterium]|nr:ABC transporter permease subunit [Lachnospiraceae bacterium]